MFFFLVLARVELEFRFYGQTVLVLFKNLHAPLFQTAQKTHHRVFRAGGRSSFH
jgi:hypothetical protein